MSIWSSFGRRLVALPNADMLLSALGVSTYIKTLLDDADAATARGTLGLGTAAVKDTGTSGDAVPLLNASNTFSAQQTISGSATFFNALIMESTAADASGGPFFNFRRTSASPAASDVLGNMIWQARNSTPAQFNACAIQASMLDPTAASEDIEIRITTSVAGANNTFAMSIHDGVKIGAPVGSYKGTGTLNATAVYDDNVVLSCYPFDAYLDGIIDEAKWDAKVPDRQHPKVVDFEEYDTGKLDADGKPIIERRQIVVREARTEDRSHADMRKFKARLGSEYDPLDIDKYTRHWKEKRHLSSMPNEASFDPVKGMPTGSWIQRLVETVEIQAIHISKLNDRQKALNDRVKALEAVK